jgi:hypothetical protein
MRIEADASRTGNKGHATPSVGAASQVSESEQGSTVGVVAIMNAKSRGMA